MASKQVSILLLGGHGRVALKLTPLLLSRSWNVTSVIRNPSHEDEIRSLAQDQPGKLDVVVASLDEVKSENDAGKVLDRVKPDWVIWAAGAGGKGGAQRTYAIDRDAAKHYIASSLSRPGIKKFLMISYIASRTGNAPWWNDQDIADAENVNTKVLPDYAKAKIVADEFLLAETERRRKRGDGGFQMINLRPGTLSDDPGTGKVVMGKTRARGKVSREDVAGVTVALLEREDTRGWFDLLEGDKGVEEEVDRLVKEGHTGYEGEDLDRIFAIEK